MDKLSDACVKYMMGIEALHLLMRTSWDTDNGPADLLRDYMDSPWHEMTPSERNLVSRFSEYLYRRDELTISTKENPSTTAPKDS